MTKIDTIIFDLGGTLIEYAGPYNRWPDLETPGFQAAYKTLHEQGATLPPFEHFRDTGFEMLPGRWQAAVSGARNLRLVDLLGEVLHTCCGVDGFTPQLIGAAAAAYERAICAQAYALEDAAETITALHEAGYRLGLLSNTMFSGRAHEEDLRRFGLHGRFQTMLFSGDVGKWKPNAAPFVHVLEALGSAAETAVFIGDSPEHDILGAQQVGLHTILIRSSQRFPHPDHIRPDATITALRDLPAQIAALSQ